MARRGVDLEGVVGYTLLVGVLTSITLITVGLVWHRAVTGGFRFDYALPPTTVVGFVLADVEQVRSLALRPRLIVNLGIATLLLTPYARVLASMVTFALERNWKYATITALVLGVLTYGLFA